MWDFYYNSFLGRILLNLMLHTGYLKLLEKLAHSSLSKHYMRNFIKKHQIDLTEYEGQTYNSFAEFFSRQKDHYDFCSDENTFISASDGLVSLYDIQDKDGSGEKFFKVKNTWYSLSELLQDEVKAKQYEGGLCVVLRLRVNDYHHFCYIDDCYHQKGYLIPGLLHSVQPVALEKEPVFKINRRYVSTMETAHLGNVTQVEVGAVLVGGIKHVSEGKQVHRGDEMGCFELIGSTIILLLEKDVKEKLSFRDDILSVIKNENECPIKMGEVLAYISE